MDKSKCYLCSRLCYCESTDYDNCRYRKQRSFGNMENRAYEDACNRLAVRFARKHNRRFDGWIGHFVPDKHNWNEGCGGHAYMDDDVVPMDDIRTDLMMDAHPNAYWQYLEEEVEEYHLAEAQVREPRHISYRNWLLGARHDAVHNSPEYNAMREQEIAEARQRLATAQAYIQRELERIGQTLRYDPEQLQRDADDLLAGSDGLY